MEQLTGKVIYKGIAIGKVSFYSKEKQQVKRCKVENPEAEAARFEQAKGQADAELDALYEKALVEVGEENAEIFQVHRMMLEDEDYNASVLNIIKNENMNAEYAVAVTSDHFAEMFEAMEDEYFKARAADIKDISERLISCLSGAGTSQGIGEEPIILLANDLAPSETVQMDKTKLLAFVTEQGSSNSHTAILARTMNLPALIGIKINPKWHGKMAVVDGYTGTLCIEPEEAYLKEMQKKKEEDERQKQLLLELKGKENVSPDGKHMHIYANIGNTSDLASVLANDAGGIGLFRSEFLYLQSDHFPTEQEQFLAYKHVVQTMGEKKVIIRTLDLGADKQAAYFNLGKEENPAMGYRAIRICLSQPDIFKTQLRAIFRASAYGNVAIMYPMIISLEEVRKIKAIVEEVKEELRKESLPFKEVEQGIMIETPAAVMISDLLAKEVDFFSIGTNDLTQYTLAIDRQNTTLDAIYDPHHEAVLRMIQIVIDNAHKEGIWAGICGELGADTTLTKRFLEMGLDEVSVAPSAVLRVRREVRK